MKPFFALFLFLLAACGASPLKEPLKKEERPKLLVSLAPYQEILEKIAGEEFAVEAVVPPQRDPHTYEPTSRQAARLAEARLWLQIGEPFEPKLLEALKRGQNTLIVYDLRKDVPLLSEEAGCCHGRFCSHSKDSFDRHIWLSPKRVKKQAAAIAEKLSEIFPEKKPLFQKNLQSLLEDLDALDKEVEETVERAKKRAFLVSHAAFAYFCADYGLEQLSLEHEGKDIRPKHLEEICRRAETTPLSFALALPQHNNKGAEILAKKLSIPLHKLDPYSPSYFSTMRSLAKLLEEDD